MKTTFFGAMALLLSCGLATAQPAAAKTEAQIIVEKCRAAYGNLKTYRGTTKTNSLSIINGEENNYGASATFTFSKPNLMRIDGKLAGGGDFSIFSAPEGSWYRWPFENSGKWKKAENLSMAVSSMTGVAALAPTTMSYLLTEPQRNQTFRFVEVAKMDGEEKLDGEACFKITAPAETETVSWWIDKKNFLLRRIVSSFDEKQSEANAAQLKKMMEKYAKQAGPGLADIKIRQVSRTEDFHIEAIDEPVDEKLFESPTPKQ